MVAPTWDAAHAKANIAHVKATIAKALTKDPRTGLPKRLSYAFLPGKSKTEHILVLHHQKKAAALLAEVRKLAPDRTVFSCGTCLIVVEGSQKLLLVKQVEKKMSMVEAKIKEALTVIGLPYVPKPDDGKIKAVEPEDEDEEAGKKNGHAPARPVIAASRPPVAAPAAKAAGIGALKAVIPPKPSAGTIHFTKAPTLWKSVHQMVHGDCQKVIGHARKHYKEQGAAVLAEVEKGLKKVEAITSNLDHSLAHALEAVVKAKDHAAQVKALGEAKRIHVEFRQFVRSDPMIKHMDANPWAPTQIQKKLELSLGQIEQTIADMSKELVAATKK